MNDLTAVLAVAVTKIRMWVYHSLSIWFFLTFCDIYSKPIKWLSKWIELCDHGCYINLLIQITTNLKLEKYEHTNVNNDYIKSKCQDDTERGRTGTLMTK